MQEANEMRQHRFPRLLCFIVTVFVLITGLLQADTLKVCPGEQLTLTYQTTQDEFLFWNIYVPYHNKSYSRLHASEGVREVTHEVVDFMVTLTFVRISESGVPPLVSQLSINNAATSLNGTTINCTEYSLSNVILQRSIHIINCSNKAPNSPQVTWRTENYNADNAMVSLEWSEEICVSYSVNVTPTPLLENKTSINASQLTILYNTSYTVVVFATLCGQNMNMAVTEIVVNQSDTCDYPVGSSLYVLGYDGEQQAVVGTTVSFNCSQPGEILIGPNTATCMEDGHWVPDLSQLQAVNCKVSCGKPMTHDSINYLSYNSTLDGSNVTYWCADNPNTSSSVCYRNRSWTPDPVNLCNIIRSDTRGLVGKTIAIIIGSSSFGAVLFIILLVIFIAVIVVCIKKALTCSHKQNLVLNVEHNYVVHDQHSEDTRETIVYADIGPSSLNIDQAPQPLKSASLFSLDLDEHRVEYAQLNHKAHSCMTAVSADILSTNTDVALNLDNLLIQLQDRSVIEILDHWLRSSSNVERSWSEVARALRKINHHQLAKEIESIDKTGKLPIEIVNNIQHEGLLPTHRSDHEFTDECPPPIPPKESHISDLQCRDPCMVSVVYCDYASGSVSI